MISKKVRKKKKEKYTLTEKRGRKKYKLVDFKDLLAINMQLDFVMILKKEWKEKEIHTNWERKR